MTAGGTRDKSCREEVSNGTQNFRNFRISGKKDNLERLTEIFEKIFRKFSVPFDFEPEFSEILVEWNAPDVTDFRTDFRRIKLCGLQGCVQRSSVKFL